MDISQTLEESLIITTTKMTLMSFPTVDLTNADVFYADEIFFNYCLSKESNEKLPLSAKRYKVERRRFGQYWGYSHTTSKNPA